MRSRQAWTMRFISQNENKRGRKREYGEKEEHSNQMGVRKQAGVDILIADIIDFELALVRRERRVLHSN